MLLDLAVTQSKLGSKGGSTSVMHYKYYQKNKKILPVRCWTIFSFDRGLVVLCGSVVGVIGSELAACELAVD